MQQGVNGLFSLRRCDEKVTHSLMDILPGQPHGNAAFYAEEMAAYGFIGQDFKTLQIFQSHGKNLVVRAPFQTMPPKRRRFIMDNGVAVFYIRFLFIPENAIFFSCFPANIHVAKMAAPFAAGIPEEHGPNILHECRLAAFVVPVHDDEPLIRRVPRDVMVNAEIV